MGEAQSAGFAVCNPERPGSHRAFQESTGLVSSETCTELYFFVDRRDLNSDLSCTWYITSLRTTLPAASPCRPSGSSRRRSAGPLPLRRGEVYADDSRLGLLAQCSGLRGAVCSGCVAILSLRSWSRRRLESAWMRGRRSQQRAAQSASRICVDEPQVVPAGRCIASAFYCVSFIGVQRRPTTVVSCGTILPWRSRVRPPAWRAYVWTNVVLYNVMNFRPVRPTCRGSVRTRRPLTRATRPDAGRLIRSMRSPLAGPSLVPSWTLHSTCLSSTSPPLGWHTSSRPSHSRILGHSRRPANRGADQWHS